VSLVDAERSRPDEPKLYDAIETIRERNYPTTEHGAVLAAYQRGKKLSKRPAVADETTAVVLTGPYVSKLQRWGQSPEKAKELVEGVVEVTRPHSGAFLDDLFSRNRRWDPGSRVRWMWGVLAERRKNPTHWPKKQHRPDKTAEAISAIMRRDGGSAYIMPLAQELGLSRNTIEGVLQSMCANEETYRSGNGRYTLAGHEAPSYVPAKDAVFNVVNAAGGREVSFEELVRANPDKPPITIRGAANSLVVDRKIIRTRPGSYALPQPSTTSWVPISHRIFQTLLDAPGHGMRRLQLESIVGGGVSTALETLRRSGLIEPAVIGSKKAIKLSKAALRKVGRGEIIRDLRRAVIWAPPVRT
jgi:hypothetical protein